MNSVQADREQPYQEPYGASDVDMRELIRTLWVGKWLIGAITFAAAVICVIVALMLPNIYRAEALLAPNQDDRPAGFSALATQYGGLANLAGLNTASEILNKTALGLEILKSRKFISKYIDQRDILVPLMAATDWDQDTNELEIDSDIYDMSTQKWVRDARPPRRARPSLQEASEVFVEEFLSVTQDKKTGFVTIAVEHFSPLVARQWVDWLVQDINSAVMHQDVAEAEQAIKYLEEQIAATPLADLRNVFFSLIEEQTKTVMLAKVSPEYLFRTVDPAIVPELKYKPKRVLIVFFGMLLGGMIGTTVVLAKRK